MSTISIFLSDLSGVTGMYLWLRKASDFSLVNAGGDALTESGTSGAFSATVAEDLSAVGLLHATISSDANETNAIADGWLPQGATLAIDHHPLAELDAAAQTALLLAMVTDDTGETSASAGSVAKLSQGSGGVASASDHPLASNG